MLVATGGIAMHEITALFGIAAALAIGAASPGPSFIMVAQTAVSTSRTNGLYAALGMGIGGVIFAVGSLLGLLGLLLTVPSLYWVLKIIGGVYLVCFGFRILLGAAQPLFSSPIGERRSSESSVKRSFVLGLTTQLSNPKTAVVYTSIFAAFLPVVTSIVFKLSVVGIVFFIEAGWYATVVLALSSKNPRNAYLRHKAWIDRVAGSVMAVLGLKLIILANRS